MTNPISTPNVATFLQAITSTTLQPWQKQLMDAVLSNATATPITAMGGTVSAATVQTVKKLLEKQTRLLTRRGWTRTVNTVSGVQYTHRDSVTCIKHAEERAGASLLGYLYRFDWCRSSRCLRLTAYKITKKTPKGWRIFLGPYSGTRQVIEGTRRKFAAPTIEKALESYRSRKTRYFHILQHQLEEARAQMEAAKLPEAYPSNTARDPLKTLRLFIGDEEFVA